MAKDQEYAPGRDVRPESMVVTRDSRSPIEDSLDLLRILEYPQLHGKTYLDHAGTTLWAKSLMTSFASNMMNDLYGNPHSEHGPSKLSGERVERTRRKALEFFNADPDDFDLVFVPNATAAVKLVHDCFRDYAEQERRNWWYGYHKDSHTSLVGVREGTPRHRCFRNDREVDLWIDARGLGGAGPHDVGLFAYPGQSNMTGRRLPLDWSVRIRNRVKAQVYTLLDAAALASTSHLDLSDTARAPDFITLSFYKIFGFPNLGALLVKKSAWRVMESRKYFGGGTVEMVIAVDDHWVAKKEAAIHSRLEDGTLPFTSIFALDIAIDTHRKLYGPSPMKQISAHTSRLIKKLHDELVALRHSNGKPVIKVYKDPTSIYGNANVQGAMIAFNVQKSNGGFVKFMDVESEANKQDIYLRSGSLCNPGGTASYLQWRPDELREAFEHGHRCSEPIPEYNGKPLGVVRASLGAMSSEDDVDTLVYFLRDTYVDRIYLEDKPLSIPEETVADLAKLTTATVLCVSDGSQTSSFETCTASSDSQSRDSPRDSVLADVRPLPAHTRKRAFRLSVDGLLAVAPNHTKARASHDFPRTNNSVIYERPPSMKTDLSRMRRFKLGVLEVMHIKQGKAMGV